MLQNIRWRFSHAYREQCEAQDIAYFESGPGYTDAALHFKTIPHYRLTPRLLFAAIRTQPLLMKCVPRRLHTVMLSEIAVQGYPNQIEHINPAAQSEPMALVAVRYDGMNLRYVREDLRSGAVCEAALFKAGNAMHYVPAAFKEPHWLAQASRRNPFILFDVQFPTDRILKCPVQLRTWNAYLEGITYLFLEPLDNHLLCPLLTSIEQVGEVNSGPIKDELLRLIEIVEQHAVSEDNLCFKTLKGKILHTVVIDREVASNVSVSSDYLAAFTI